MKEKEIIKGLRQRLDQEMIARGFKFDSKKGDYLRVGLNDALYFKISFLFLDFVASGTNHKSKYLEIFLEIYHRETSTILWETTSRGKNLDSFFYFKVVGNMLSDIVLNPNWTNYTSRNNHNHFKLTFVEDTDIKARAEDVLSIVDRYAIPFFEKLDSINKIKSALDCCYNGWVSIHNVNHERLLALAVLLFETQDSLKEEKIQMIKDYFASVNNDEALSALDQIVQRFVVTHP